MLGATLTTVATFLYGTLVGWSVHWMLHQRWSGRLHQAHMNHHMTQYPPEDMLSEKYRSAGKDDSTFLFAPFVLAASAGYVFALVRLHMGLGLVVWALVETALIAFLHDWLHEQFHLRRSILNRWPAFERLRELHDVHHRHMQRNFGIFWFGWDRVFRTRRRP